MILLGLTGSMGMGKTMAASMLQSLGVPVHDADEAARECLEPDGAAIGSILNHFSYKKYPQIYETDGVRIRRKALAALVFEKPDERKKLEDIVHPLVRASQDRFVLLQQKNRRQIVVLDIPLLFETGAEQRVDRTMVVTAPAAVQRRRILERPGMNEPMMDRILLQQMPDKEKRSRADYVIRSGLGRAFMMRDIRNILQSVRKTF